jgi:hypothetical protein
MIGTVMRALGFFAISALLFGQGLLILWGSLRGWPVTVPGVLAVLTGAGLWGLIAIEGLLGQLRLAESSESVPSWAPLLTFAAAIGAFYLAAGSASSAIEASGPISPTRKAGRSDRTWPQAWSAS